MNILKDITFNSEKKIARQIESLKSMIESVWCYGGGKNNEYIKKYREEMIALIDELIDESFKELDDNYTTAYAGEDSEGVTYNTIVKK